MSRLPSAFRLKRRRLIGALFSSRHRALGEESRNATQSKTRGTVRVLYRFADRESSGSSAPYQIGFSASKKVKRAVDRNRIKRLLRVAFQHMRPKFDDLPVLTDQTLSIMVLFRGAGRSVENRVLEDATKALERVADHILVQLSDPALFTGVNKRSSGSNDARTRET
ncbi:MAG: ribonuclease P protein component [Rhodothermales bacterium]|nr:ribonuclease P protein component [Rhodothermales bacterium]